MLRQGLPARPLTTNVVQNPYAIFHSVISYADAGVSTSIKRASLPYCRDMGGILTASGLYVFVLRWSSPRVSTMRKIAPSTPTTMPYDRVNWVFPARTSALHSGTTPGVHHTSKIQAKSAIDES